MKTLTWQKPGQQNVAQELIKIIINYVAELRFNLKYPLKADFSLVQKAYLSGYRFRKIDSYIAYFSMEGATGTSYRIMDKEHLSILRDNHAVLFPRLVMGLIGIKKIIKVFYLKFFYGK